MTTFASTRRSARLARRSIRSDCRLMATLPNSNASIRRAKPRSLLHAGNAQACRETFRTSRASFRSSATSSSTVAVCHVAFPTASCRRSQTKMPMAMQMLLPLVCVPHLAKRPSRLANRSTRPTAPFSRHLATAWVVIRRLRICEPSLHSPNARQERTLPRSDASAKRTPSRR